MNSRGIQLSGGFGREMANLIVDGVTQIDMFGYNITRFQDSYVRNQKWLEETTHEAIVSLKAKQDNYDQMRFSNIPLA